MSDVRVDLDRLTDDAWRGFRSALADAIDGLAPGASALVTLAGWDGEDCPPHAFATNVFDQIRVQVASNRVMSPEYRISRKACAHLRRLGLKSPAGDENCYWSEYPLDHADEAAAVIVSAFRDGFATLHPAFLDCADMAWRSDSHLPTTDVVPEPAIAVHPIDREHLNRLVEEALDSVVGCLPERDDDGDLPIRSGSTVVFVRPHEHVPVLRLFALMAVDITDLEAAARETVALNREIEGVKFMLLHDVVVAAVDLPAMPFVADHLRAALARMIAVVSANDAILVSRVGGRTFASQGACDDEGNEDMSDSASGDEYQSTDGGIHPVMLCLLQLDAEKPGSVKPKDAAKLCGYDRDLLLELIRWNEEQEIAWREARDEASQTQEFDEAAACEHERAHAERTTKVLRKALRNVVLG